MSQVAEPDLIFPFVVSGGIELNRVLGRGGRLILRQVGATSRRISDLAYDGGAWLSWRTQAATLRAAIFPEVQVRRPGARAGARAS